MKKWQRRAALAFFVIAAGAAVKAVDIGFGGFDAPGPGFFPFWLAVLLAVVAVVYYAANREADAAAQPSMAAGHFRRPAIAVVIILLYTQALDFLGFATATFFLFTAWLKGVEQERWTKVGLVAVIGTVAVYVVFAVLLHLSLPHGLLI